MCWLSQGQWVSLGWLVEVLWIFVKKKNNTKTICWGRFSRSHKTAPKTSALKPILLEAVSCQQLPHQAAIAKFTYHDTSHTSVSMVGPFWCRDVFVGLPANGLQPPGARFCSFVQKMLIIHNTCKYIYILYINILYKDTHTHDSAFMKGISIP